jgi:ATP-dependent DNA ligase
MIINGEYMNKSKGDEIGKVFNHKLIIFDILVYNGDYLIGSTFSERVNLLDNIYGVTNSEKDYLFSVTDNIYRVKSYNSDFSNIFNKFIQVDMLEGLVMKRSNSKLEIGLTESNNIRGQLKCRKPTLNYKY